MKTLIHTIKGARVIETENIIYCQADGHHTEIYLFKKSQNDKKDYFISTKMISEIEKLLPKTGFYRCHKSFLINFKSFLEFDVAKSCIIMETGKEIKISREKKIESKKRLLAYFEYYNSFSKVPFYSKK
jgi:two-component system, LytTR family, response regulator